MDDFLSRGSLGQGLFGVVVTLAASLSDSESEGESEAGPMSSSLSEGSVEAIDLRSSQPEKDLEVEYCEGNSSSASSSDEIICSSATSRDCKFWMRCSGI